MMMIGNSEALPDGGSMQSKTRAIVIVLSMGLMAGCSTGSVTKEEGDALLKSSQASRQEWNKIDPQFEAFAKKGYGYAFFPEITNGGLILRGAQRAMAKFKRNEMDLGANASAVLADKGAAASAQFVDGVAVFVRPIRG